MQNTSIKKKSGEKCAKFLSFLSDRSLKEYRDIVIHGGHIKIYLKEYSRITLEYPCTKNKLFNN